MTEDTNELKTLAQGEAAHIVWEHAPQDATGFTLGTVRHIATLAYLAGYGKGHSEATAYAVERVKTL